MASTACHHALGLIQAQGNSPRTGLQDKVGSFSLELVSKGFDMDIQLLSRGSHYPGSRKLCLVRASSSHSSVADPITISSNSNSSDSQKRSRCAYVPLTQKGVEEAIEAGKRISNIPIDMIYASSLIRAQMTAMLAMTQHRRKKIVPQLLSGKNVMIAAHGNSLRYIIMYLDKLTSEEVISLELSAGIPMLLYILKKGKFIGRGSPIGPSEAGVYAYTRSLALYRQKLDEMVQ
ncbi:2,3-bisphosphoglycerate-dependent phosphoglycerate mutase 1-like [Musa acuminata AAA Group]|uniref:2,3-bisphosphoglycerate-dependent phosphoglycerate mutase 1-like n=1 Tax=Musa acuminata AAA Group TaxID=214697 RepID=UPI0031D306B3